MTVHPAFAEFRELLAGLIRRHAAEYPQWSSLEWFWLRYLRQCHRSAMEAKRPGDVEESIRALTRFYVDAVDEHSELADEFRSVLEAHRYAVRRVEAAAEEGPLGW